MIFLSQQIMENYWTNNDAILLWRDASSSLTLFYWSNNGAERYLKEHTYMLYIKFLLYTTFQEHY